MLGGCGRVSNRIHDNDKSIEPQELHDGIKRQCLISLNKEEITNSGRLRDALKKLMIKSMFGQQIPT